MAISHKDGQLRRSYHAELYTDRDRNKVAYFPGFVVLNEPGAVKPDNVRRSLPIIPSILKNSDSDKKKVEEENHAIDKNVNKSDEKPYDFVARFLQLDKFKRTDETVDVGKTQVFQQQDDATCRSQGNKSKRKVTFSLNNESYRSSKSINENVLKSAGRRRVLTVGHKLPTMVSFLIFCI